MQIILMVHGLPSWWYKASSFKATIYSGALEAKDVLCDDENTGYPHQTPLCKIAATTLYQMLKLPGNTLPVHVGGEATKIAQTIVAGQGALQQRQQSGGRSLGHEKFRLHPEATLVPPHSLTDTSGILVSKEEGLCSVLDRALHELLNLILHILGCSILMTSQTGGACTSQNRLL